MHPDAWNDDSIQFVRLLAEVHAVLGEPQWNELLSSMDLTSDQLSELFDRVERRWEAIKARTSGAGLELLPDSATSEALEHARTQLRDLGSYWPQRELHEPIDSTIDRINALIGGEDEQPPFTTAFLPESAAREDADGSIYPGGSGGQF